jgi:TPR repeat protein
MKRLLVIAAFLLSLVIGLPAFAASLQRGLDAYKKQNYGAAVREWKPLAQQGQAIAQFYLGFMYSEGKGVLINPNAAFKWYSLAAKQGHSSAQHNLAAMYATGRGGHLDYKAAAKWYGLAAAQGNASAQFQLAVMYAKGSGVEYRTY